MAPQVVDNAELSIFESGLTYHAKNAKTANEKRVCIRQNAIVAPPVSNVIVDGEIKLRNFMERFISGFRFGTKPLRFGEFQMEFMDLCAQVVAPNIVGPKWDIIGPKICKQLKWKLQRGAKLVLGQAPRRFGKTVSIAALMVNYALEVVGAVESAFTTSKRTSQNLKKKVLQMIVESGYGPYIVRYGEEVVMLRNPEKESDRPSIMSFYPSNHKIESGRGLHMLFAFCLFAQWIFICTHGIGSFILLFFIFHSQDRTPPPLHICHSCTTRSLSPTKYCLCLVGLKLCVLQS